MAKEFKKAYIIGDDVISSSFTLSLAMSKMDATLYNLDENGENRLRKIVEKYVDELIERNIISKDKQTIMTRIRHTIDEKEAIEFADVVEKCIPENYDMKKEFVKVLEKYTKPDHVLCSATSGLFITKIAENAKHSERVLETHSCNPSHSTPLTEISQGEKSDPEIADAPRELFVRLGKKLIITGNEVSSFVTDRLQAVVLHEAMDLVSKGVVSMEDCETALTFGPAVRWAVMGPGQVFELGGGEHGPQGLPDHIDPSTETWLEDAAIWTKFTDGIKKRTVDGIHEAIKNRPQDVGNTHETSAKYRDGMLVETLRLHKDYKI